MYRVVFFVFATLPYLASATITLGKRFKVRETFMIYLSFYVSACFSIPFTTLPSITLNGLNPILNTSAVSFTHSHIVLKIAFSRTDGPKVCSSISDWIRALITQFDWLKNSAADFKSSCP